MRMDERIWKYLILILAAFYIVPIFMRSTDGEAAGLLVVIPVICLVTGFFAGREYGFQWLYPIIVGILFFPSIFIFYNSSALFYCVAFGIVSLIGNGIGSVFRKK